MIRGQASLALDEGRQARDQGTNLVSLAEWPEDRRRIDAVIEHLAQTRRAFTADDVWPFLPEGTRPNALGSGFLRAAKAGTVQECGYRQSERPSARARRILVWRGVA